MKHVVLRTNAIPVYGFLCVIIARQSQGEALPRGKILDCGAGGELPPLSLFHQQGFSTWGIDISAEQLQSASEFCDDHMVPIRLHEGDMRHIPFADEAFDYVYEHYSMCHLTKQDTVRTIHEMYRVLKKGGLCFLGVISMDTWPRSIFGEEKEPGQFWDERNEDQSTWHSMFTDEEADQLVSGWEIISKEKRISYLREMAEELSLNSWMELYEEAEGRYSREEWKAKYKDRTNKFQYTHLYYILEKMGKIES